MISDALLITLIVSGVISVLAMRYRSQPMMLVSSIGGLISAAMIYQELTSAAPCILLIFLSFAQFLLLRSE